MKNAFKQNKQEILYKLINASIAGALVFFGSVVGSGGNIGLNGLIASAGAGFIVILNQFKDYWTSQEKEYASGKKARIRLFNFV